MTATGDVDAGFQSRPEDSRHDRAQRRRYRPLHAHPQRRGGCRQLQRTCCVREPIVFVHFHLPAIGNTVTIPSNTLLFRAEGLRVGVVRGGRVQLVPVTIGHDFGSSVEITSGLTAADEVILDPSDSLASGIRGASANRNCGRPVMIEVHNRRAAIVLLVAGLGLALSGCRVGPQYVRPVNSDRAVIQGAAARELQVRRRMEARAARAMRN